MKHYFSIQLKRLVRFLEERGFSIVLASILLLGLFAGGTYFLMQRTPFAALIILGIQVVVILPLANKSRYDHLQLIFKVKQVFQVRLLENLFVAVPFITCIAIADWRVTAFSMLVSVLFAFPMKFGALPYSLPTPFRKMPVYFPSGFRRFLLGHLLTVVLCGFALIIKNYNLGLFSIILNWLLVYTYYSKLEPLEYVWTYAKTPKQFLRSKLKEGLLASTFIILPFMITFIFADVSSWYIPVLIYLLGLLNLLNLILATYAGFPDEMSMPNGILVAFSMMLPPLTIIAVIYFYRMAQINLKTILHDSPK